MGFLEKIMVIVILGCILCMFGFVALFTYPPKTEKKPMTMDECLQTIGNYELCENKMRGNNG